MRRYFSRLIPYRSFQEVYAKVDPTVAASLQSFRQEHPPKSLSVDGAAWEYLALGNGEAVLFLHGAAGAYDIWWQQMEALKGSYQVLSLTFPPVDSLEVMAAGVLAILEKEEVGPVNLVGSSLGGYLAQYLIAAHPGTARRAVFANTFPPNELLFEQNRTLVALLPYLPEWLVMRVLRNTYQKSIYPAAGFNELVLAYLMEISYGRISKAQVVGRLRSAIEIFEPPGVEAMGIPVMILEASNDPLIEKALREQLQSTYPSARVVNLGEVGHFSYLNEGEEYTRVLGEFLQGTLN